MRVMSEVTQALIRIKLKILWLTFLRNKLRILRVVRKKENNLSVFGGGMILILKKLLILLTGPKATSIRIQIEFLNLTLMRYQQMSIKIQ